MIRRINIIIVMVIIIQTFTPWWIIIPIASINGWFSLNKRMAIISSMCGVCFAWGIVFLIKYLTGGVILVNRVAVMLNLHNGIILFIITISVAAIFALLGSISGFYLWKLNNKAQL